MLLSNMSEPDESIAFRDGWPIVNGVSSHVLTWGGWIEDPLPEGDSVLVFIGGVPGITLFYQQFLESLYNHLGIPVWTICAAGHELPAKSSDLELVKDTSSYDTIQAQVDHKMAFIEKYVPKNHKIYFVAHSFGAKILVELIKNEQIKRQVNKAILLMPILERARETPRAQFWLSICNTGLIHLLVLFLHILQLLPFSWRKQACHLYYKRRGMNTVHNSYYEALDQFCNPRVFHNVQSLLLNEVDAIQCLDTEVIAGFRDKMKVYFALNDNWLPLTYYESLKSAVPELTIEILDEKFVHAFTLNTPEDMAEKIASDFDIN